MSSSPEQPSVAIREVPAVFGRKEVRPDPLWEWEFASSLKEKSSREELHALYARHIAGEGGFDAMMRRIIVRAMCKYAGHGLQVGPNVVFKHPETMEFGDAVFIGAQAMIQGRYDGTCKIGNHVWIGPQAYFDARAIELEDYVGWGPGAKVLGSAHTGDPVDAPIIATSLVIKPVHVGANAIVGAGAVVTQDVPEYAIVAGVPAKFLRSRRDT